MAIKTTLKRFCPHCGNVQVAPFSEGRIVYSHCGCRLPLNPDFPVSAPKVFSLAEVIIEDFHIGQNVQDVSPNNTISSYCVTLYLERTVSQSYGSPLLVNSAVDMTKRKVAVELLEKVQSDYPGALWIFDVWGYYNIDAQMWDMLEQASQEFVDRFKRSPMHLMIIGRARLFDLERFRQTSDVFPMKQDRSDIFNWLSKPMKPFSQ